MLCLKIFLFSKKLQRELFFAPRFGPDKKYFFAIITSIIINNSARKLAARKISIHQRESRVEAHQFVYWLVKGVLEH